MTPEELNTVANAVAARISADAEARYKRTKEAAVTEPRRKVEAQELRLRRRVPPYDLEGPEEPEEASVDRRLGVTEEGRTQRILLATIAVAAALAFGLGYLGIDATPAYSLMAAASAALLGNAWLGGKRQEAKAKVEAVREGGI